MELLDERLRILRGSCSKGWWPGTESNRRRRPFQGRLPYRESGLKQGLLLTTAGLGHCPFRMAWNGLGRFRPLDVRVLFALAATLFEIVPGPLSTSVFHKLKRRLSALAPHLACVERKVSESNQTNSLDTSNWRDAALTVRRGRCSCRTR